MFTNHRHNEARQEFTVGVTRAVDDYIHSAPLWDEDAQRTVTRQRGIHLMQNQLGARIDCKVTLHEGSNLDPGTYNTEWTQGLLKELAGVLGRNGYHVKRMYEDGKLSCLYVFPSDRSQESDK